MRITWLDVAFWVSCFFIGVLTTVVVSLILSIR